MRHLAMATVVAFAALTSPVAAAPATVDATDDNTFEPREVTVEVGEAVTWRFGPRRPHYVENDPESTEVFNSSPTPAAPVLRDRANPRGSTWPHTFSTSGRFTYHCPIHVAAGIDMRGVVNVVAPPPTTSGGGPPLQAPPAVAQRPVADTRAPKIRALRASLGRRRADVVLRLSEPARLAGRIESARPRRTLRRFSIRGRQGLNRIQLSARRLRPGRYRVLITATDAAGNGSVRVRTALTVLARR
jgi:plastocyanin